MSHELLLWIALLIFGLSATITLLKSLSTTDFLERVTCLELIGVIVMGVISTVCLLNKRSDFLDTVLLLSFVSFMSSFGLIYYFKNQKEADQKARRWTKKWK